MKPVSISRAKTDESPEPLRVSDVPLGNGHSSSFMMKLKRIISDFRAFDTDSTKVMLAEQDADIRKNWDVHRAELLETVVLRLKNGASVEKIRGLTEPSLFAEALEIHRKTAAR